MKTREDGWIYVLQEVTGGPFKIGFANDIVERIKQLQTGNWRELKLVAFHRGSSKLEAQLHRIHARHRIRSEWFADCADVREVVDACLQFMRDDPPGLFSGNPDAVDVLRKMVEK